MTDRHERLMTTLGSPAASRELAVGRASAALATLIAQRLAAKGMTQVQLAEALGITPGAVSRKLNQGSDMRISSAAAILWAVDVALYREFERLCTEGWRGMSLASETNVVPFPTAGRRANFTTPQVLQAPGREYGT